MPDIRPRLNGRWLSDAETVRWNALWADLDRFIEGRTFDPSSQERLSPKADRLLVIKSVRSRPGLRVLERFALPDVLIGLDAFERAPAGPKDSRA